MFNNYSYKGGNVATNINAVTGAILKNHPKSWFERFHLKSSRADRLLKEGGDKETWNAKPITVLQMVICGDMEVIAECIYTEDLINKENQNEE